MKAIPLHRISTIRPFTQFLDRVGMPVERQMRKSNLPVLAFEDPECYVPSQNYWSFVERAAKHEAIEDLGFLVGQEFGAETLGPDLTSQLLRLPTVRDALNLFCNLNNKSIALCRLWFERLGQDDFRLCYKPSFAQDHPAYIHFQWYGLMGILGTIQTVAGSDWRPSHIGLGANKLPGVNIREIFPATRFSAGRPHCFIVIEKNILDRPLKTHQHEDPSSIELPANSPADELPDMLKQLLRAYVLDRKLSIADLAGLSGLSIRTLQRQLSGLGLSYRDLLNQVRIEIATDYLRNRDLNIREISNLLHYKNPSHFNRAFKKATGVIPSKYQKTKTNTT